MPPIHPYRILALGDSYTVGEGVALNENFPAQLTARLRLQGLESAEPQIVAQTGWTTGELLAMLDQLSQNLYSGYPYHLVTLLAGVNNQYRGGDLEEYQWQFDELLDRARTFAGDIPQRVIVLSIPDWGATPFASGRERAKIALEIDTFNAVNRGLAEAAGVNYVDVTAISRRAGFESGLLAADGLHPSAQMYATWVDVLYQPVLSVLTFRSKDEA